MAKIDGKFLFAAGVGALVGSVLTLALSGSGAPAPMGSVDGVESVRPPARHLDEVSPGEEALSPTTPGPATRGFAGHTTEAGVEYFLNPKQHVFATAAARRGELRAHGLPAGAPPDAAAAFMGLDSLDRDGQLSQAEILTHLGKALPQLATPSVARAIIRAFDVGAPGMGGGGGGAVADVAGNGFLEWGEFKAFYSKVVVWQKLWHEKAKDVLGAEYFSQSPAQVMERELPAAMLQPVFEATFNTPELRTPNVAEAIDKICKVRCAGFLPPPPPSPPSASLPLCPFPPPSPSHVPGRSPPRMRATAWGSPLHPSSASCWGLRPFTTTTWCGAGPPPPLCRRWKCLR